MTVTVPIPQRWRGEVADSYGSWARQQSRALAELDDALDRAAREIEAGGDGLAARLAAIDLPLAVPVRAEAVGDAPAPVGDSDAPVSAAERDAANRRRLAADLRALLDQPHRSRAQQRRLQMVQAIDSRLAVLSKRRDPVTGAPLTVQLVVYEPGAFNGDGAVVVSIGDLDRADSIGVLVPGMGTTAASLGPVLQGAVALHDAARRVAPQRLTATLAWIGYDAPSGSAALAEAATADRARSGAAYLRDDLQEIARLRGTDPRVVLFGHSYGSTVTATAGAQGAMSGYVDALVLLGSPGAGPVRSAAEFSMPGEVFVAVDRDDPVTRVGATDGAVQGLNRVLGGRLGLGTDPAAPGFGAARIDVSGPDGFGPAAHSGYLAEGSRALDAFARILTGSGRG